MAHRPNTAERGEMGQEPVRDCVREPFHGVRNEGPENYEDQDLPAWQRDHRESRR